MANLKDIKLVPRDLTSDSFTTGSMTIELDERGEPRLLDDSAALNQDILKAIFTGVQPDGYGTVIRNVVGEKNTGVVKAMLSFTIISSLQVLRKIHNELRKEFPTQFRGRRCLANVDFIHVEDVTVTSVLIKVDLRDRENTMIAQAVQYNNTKE